MTKSVEQVLFALPIFIAVILLLLLAGLLILFASLILIRRNRADKEREETWVRRQTVVSDRIDTAPTQVDEAPDPNAYGILTVQASDDRAIIGRSFSLTQPITTLGCSPENDIPFPKDSPVSRHHARIEKRETGIFIVEITSPDMHGHPRQPRFGTFINQVRIMAEEMILNSGDIVRLGKRVEVRFESASPVSTGNEKTYPAFGNQNEEEKIRPKSVQKGDLPATGETYY